MFIPLPCGPILSSRPMVPSRLVPYLLSFPSVMLWRHTDSEHVVCFVVMARACLGIIGTFCGATSPEL